MSASIAILDYGMGNLRSVEKALERVGARPWVTSDHADARTADGIVLPGVGAFPRAMRRVRELGLDLLLDERVAAGTPVIGICLGMQLLLDSSTELGGDRGLGLIAGEVTELDAGEGVLPHIGWEPVRWQRGSALCDGLADGEPFYFVHSFVARPEDDADTIGVATHGETFACVIERDTVFGVQFHPEKSSAAGLRLLANFASICAGRRVAAA